MYTHQCKENLKGTICRRLGWMSVDDTSLPILYLVYHRVKAVPTLAACPYQCSLAERKIWDDMLAYKQRVGRSIFLEELKALDVPFPAFQRHFLSAMICNPDAVCTFFENEGITDLRLQIYHLQAVRWVYERLYSAPASGDIPSELQMKQIAHTYQTGTADKQELEHIEQTDTLHYRDTSGVELLDWAQLQKLYEAITVYQLDSSQMSVAILPGDGEKVMDILQRAKIKLCLGSTKLNELIRDFLNDALLPKDMADKYGGERFRPLSEAAQDMKRFKELSELLAQVTPLELLCGNYLQIGSGRHVKKGAPPREPLGDAQNDVTLENGPVYEIVRSHLYSTNSHGIIILGPTPLFVRKWMSDRALNHVPVTFVMEEQTVAELLRIHYRDYDPTDKDVAFVSMDTWTAEETQPWGIVLLFAVGWEQAKLEVQLQALETACTKQVFQLFAMVNSEISDGDIKTVPTALTADPKIHLMSILMFPTGVGNGKKPRKKQLIRGGYWNVKQEYKWEDQVTIYQMQLIKGSPDFPGKALRLMQLNGRPCLRVPSRELGGNLRKYIYQVTHPNSSGKTRSMPQAFSYAPELTVYYCVIGKPTASGKVKYQCYVCEPDPEGRKGRGRRIRDTLKQLSLPPEQDVEEWLNHGYINAEIMKKDESEAVHSVREAIGNSYREAYRGKEISMKLLWLIYPDMEDTLSAAQCDWLHRLLDTDLGRCITTDLTEDSLFQGVKDLEPNPTREKLLSRIRTLHIVLNFACQMGHCIENPLDRVIRDQRHQNKRLADVRSALTMKNLPYDKHFEMFELITSRIRAGQFIYLGLLIRFLTGLESNIVCALRWKDLQKSHYYDFYVLSIVRQLPNQGGEPVGFQDRNDYRKIPCSDLLREFLLEQKERVRDWLKASGAGRAFAELPIVTCNPLPGEDWAVHEPVAPRELEALGWNALKDINLGAHVVTLPLENGGTKESNLSAYNGDFFRENARYWLGALCRLDRDELAHMMGNRKFTTAGDHYVDYQGDDGLLYLREKLNRLDHELHYHGALLQAKRLESGAAEHTSQTLYQPEYKHMHVRATVQAAPQSGNKPVRAIIRSEKGMRLSSSEVQSCSVGGEN